MIRLPHWEIIDYAHGDKIDAPSGTVRELAARMAAVRQPEQVIPVDQCTGEREARGATVNGAQVHSLRLPGYVISAEAIFGCLTNVFRSGTIQAAAPSLTWMERFWLFAKSPD
jgi:dihydrodipicolinate reductase